MLHCEILCAAQHAIPMRIVRKPWNIAFQSLYFRHLPVVIRAFRAAAFL